MNSTSFNTKIIGHVKIADINTGEILLDRDNSVNNQNMASAIARGLAAAPAISGLPINNIYQIKLGNGGTSVNSLDQITYLPPNTTGTGATLYNETYSQIVDQYLSGTPPTNSVTYQPSGTDTTSIVIATMTISAGEPTGQDLTDSPPDPNFNSQFSFDELGMFTSDGLLLTHIIFNPILKTANRSLVITYTLTVAVS
jgi:hypothetical protein